MIGSNVPVFPEHFTLEELCITQHRGIDNTPPPEIVSHLADTAWKLESVRRVIQNTTIIISSGYRCEKLENAVCWDAYQEWCKNTGSPYTQQSWERYFKRKAHPQGYAADFIAPRFGTPAAIVAAIKASDTRYDQLILEATWVHISFDPRMRMQSFSL